MANALGPGDYLIFQLESGYGLLRVLGVDSTPEATVWHLAAFADLFMDVAAAEAALANASALTVVMPHAALTNRAFESTQVAKIGNSPLTEAESEELTRWNEHPQRKIHDRSIRLLLGLR